MGGLVPEGGDAGFLHGPFHPAADFLGGQTQIHCAEGDIPVHVGGEQLVVRVLEDDAHFLAQPPQTLLVEGHRLPAEQYLTGTGGAHAVQVEKQRGFSRPVGAQNPGDLPGLRPEADAVQGLGSIFVGIDQISGLNGVFSQNNAPPTSSKAAARTPPPGQADNMFSPAGRSGPWWPGNRYSPGIPGRNRWRRPCSRPGETPWS